MEEQFSDRMMKVERLIEMAKRDEEIQGKLKSGEKELVMSVLEGVGLSEDDVSELVNDLEMISASVGTLGFWRFGD